MAEKNVWIRASIFYCKPNWHLLLNDCLRPLLNGLQDKKLITIYILSFSYNQGENVRLLISTKTKVFQKAAQKIDSDIKLYLKKHPSHRPESANPVTGFFMDMPNNTISYNMYNDVLYAAFENTLRYRLSIVIIKAICTETFNYKNVFSFLLYAHASILKMHCYNKKDAAAMAKDTAGIVLPGIGTYTKDDIDLRTKSLFAENKEILKDIIKDVWMQDRSKASDLKWLGEFENALVHYFKTGISPNEGYRNISSYIIYQTKYPDPGVFNITSNLLHLALLQGGN